MTENRHRPLSQIATEVYLDWKPVGYAALPYLRAMQALDQITETYGDDPASQIVAYFLSNAKTWKGETARRVKAELRAILAGKH